MRKKAICIAFLFAVCGLAQSSSVGNTQVMVQVRAEVSLTWQGDTAVLVKARLAPGTEARVWADQSCAIPTAGAQVVSSSGTVVIQLADMGAAGSPMVCLSSSDGRLSASLAARN